MNKLYCLILFIFSIISSNGKIWANDSIVPSCHYDVLFYHLDIELYNTSTYIEGNVLIRIKSLSDTDTLFLELSNKLEVSSLLINDSDAAFIHENDTLKCISTDTLYKDDIVELKVFYKGKVVQEGFLSGLSTGFHGETFINATWSLSEPFSGKDWFPCKQDLNDKADSVYVYITTSSFLKAGANGILTNSVELPGNKIRYEWKSSYPVTYYLISVAISEYMEYNIYAHPKGREDSILIQNYIYDNSNYFEKVKDDINVTVDMLELFSELFGEYPFFNEKYGHCVAPMQGGGMEHQTMTTLSQFNFELIAHELAHSWFGNSVTCSSWQDIWINEGFASYSEYLAIENLKSKESARAWINKTHSRALGNTTGSIYIPEEEITNKWRIFDVALSYKKGAAVIHMIRFELNNDELFFDILSSFLEKYKYGNAGIEDFKEVLEEKSGKNFDVFFEQWIYGTGYPIFKINWKHENDTLIVYSRQESVSYKPSVFQTSLEFGVYGMDIDSIFRVFQSTNKDTFYIPCSGMITKLEFDPNSWLLKKAEPLPRKLATPENKLFKVHPNPFKEKITLFFKTEDIDFDINITDVNGNIVERTRINQNNYSFSTKNWEDGIYLVNVFDKNRIHTEKIIKN